MNFARILLFLLLVSCNNSTKIPDNFGGKVVGVKDGDTIEVLFEGKSQTIRLVDIDCPEKKQAFGAKAKQFTSDFCFGKEVSIESNGKRDRYNRILGTVYVENKNLNQELVKAGLAWHYRKYSDKQIFADLEQTARENKIGLWADSDPIAPWDFRPKRK
jgi:endonuclease YncB( thermonuclease family)